MSNNKIHLTGHIKEFLGEDIEMPIEINDTEMLLAYLYKKFPMLTNYSLRISIDGNLIKQKTDLAPSSEILIFTPFAGG